MTKKRAGSISAASPDLQSAGSVSPLFEGCKLDDLEVIDQPKGKPKNPLKAWIELWSGCPILIEPIESPSASAAPVQQDRTIWVEHLMCMVPLPNVLDIHSGKPWAVAQCVRCYGLTVKNCHVPMALRPPEWNPFRTAYGIPPGTFLRWSRVRDDGIEIASKHPKARFIVPCCPHNLRHGPGQAANHQ